MAIVTRSARRATRLVCGGSAALRAMKRAAHRANRAAARRALRAGCEISPCRPVCGRDVA